jgi:hypothetical protein
MATMLLCAIMKSSIRNVTGRLVEIYVRDREVINDTGPIAAQLTQAAQGALKHGGQLVVVSDFRTLNVVGPKLANYIIQVMRGDNKVLLRSGLLCDDNATFGMQIERVIRESGHTERKRFTKIPELTAWLGEVLTEDEKGRLDQFLESGPLPG